MAQRYAEQPTLDQLPSSNRRASSPHPSAVLQAANDRLLALRLAQTQTNNNPLRPSPQPESPLPATLTPATHPLTSLPAHLGWESAAVTAVLRRRMPAHPAVAGSGKLATAPGGPVAEKTAVCPSTTCSPTPLEAGGLWPPPQAAIKLYPSLALALLHKGQATCGRLWLLLRHLDSEGRGCLPLTAVRAQLTERASPLRLCGERQLRSLLRQGNGLFWQRDEGYLWLASTVKVAARLGVTRLSGRPVALPLPLLVQPIGQVRAQLYASFHSSRQGAATQEAGPISRETLTAISGISSRSQHTYEQRAHVQVRRNLAVGPPASPKTREETAWRRGQAAFDFRDGKGSEGPPGRQYLAWQLPNSYRGPHAHLARGRQRQLNRQLADLRDNGDAGNGRLGGEGGGRRRYATKGVAAERFLRQWPAVEVYWQAPTRRGTAIWYVLSLGEGGG